MFLFLLINIRIDWISQNNLYKKYLFFNQLFYNILKSIYYNVLLMYMEDTNQILDNQRGLIVLIYDLNKV